MLSSSFLVLLGLVSVSYVNAGDRLAQWMSGKWGIGFRIHAYESMIEAYNVDQFIEQLRTVKGDPAYVIVNLSGPANGGDIYLSHNPTLWSIGNTLATPAEDGRDLFAELLDAIHGEGLKVIVYMAAQGPALFKAGITKSHDWDGTESAAYNNWVNHVNTTYGTRPEGDYSNFYEAYANDIVSYYADKFGTEIDGWWFDQGSSCDRKLVEAACRGGNPAAVVAINYGGQKSPLKVNNPGIADYTYGHPNPLRRTKPSSSANLGMVTSVEDAGDGWIVDEEGNEALGHLFMPIANTWNSINYKVNGTDKFYNVWEEDQAVDWMSRVLTSGGAWTWNIPRQSNRADRLSILRPDFIEFINNVADRLPLLCPDSVCGEDGSEAGEYWSACVVMDKLNQYGVCHPKTSWVFIYESLNYCGACDGYCYESPQDTDPCDDAHYCTFTIDSVTLASATCSWLREQSTDVVDLWCDKLDTQEICPETCGICSDSCEDSLGNITIDGDEQPCSYLAAIPSLHDEICDSNHSSGAWEICAETCGNCNGEYVSNIWSPLDCSDDACGKDGNLWNACYVSGTQNQVGVCHPQDSWAFIYESPTYCGPCVGGSCIEPTDDWDPCDDAHYCTFNANWVSKSCHWLREQDAASIAQFCQQIDAQEACPETCDICADTCEDDPSDGAILIDGTPQDCDYLAANPDMRGDVCGPNHGSDAWSTCAETCGNCGGIYIEL